QASGAVNGCVNVKTRALTIPGTGPCKKGTQSVGWNVTGPAGPAGTSGFGLTVPGTRFNFFTSVVFDGTNLWVDGRNGNSVAEVSPGSRSILRQFSGGKYNFQLPAAMAVGGGDLWVLNAGDNSVTELRTSDGAFVRRLAGARYNLSAKAVLAVADGRLWVANPARKFITEISASTGAVLGKISGAKYGFSSPSALDFAGGHLWVANATGDSVTEISASDGGFVRKLSGFDNPVVMASAGRQLWGLGQGGGQFSVGEATEVNPDTG